MQTRRHWGHRTAEETTCSTRRQVPFSQSAGGLARGIHNLPRPGGNSFITSSAVAHPLRAVSTPSRRKSKCKGAWASLPMASLQPAAMVRRTSSAQTERQDPPRHTARLLDALALRRIERGATSESSPSLAFYVSPPLGLGRRRATVATGNTSRPPLQSSRRPSSQTGLWSSSTRLSAACSRQPRSCPG